MRNLLFVGGSGLLGNNWLKSLSKNKKIFAKSNAALIAFLGNKESDLILENLSSLEENTIAPSIISAHPELFSNCRERTFIK